MNHLHPLIFVFFVGFALTACDLFQIQIDRDPAPVYDSSLKSSAAQDKEDSDQKDDDQPVVPTVLPVSDGESLLTLLRYSRYVANLTEKRLHQEYTLVSDVNEADSSSRELLKMAVLLSQPSTKFQDDEHARRLLIDFIMMGEQVTPVMLEYAHLLLDTLQRRVESRKKYEKLAKRLKQERRRRKQLEGKLEALKSIEKSITKRQIETEAKSQ